MTKQERAAIMGMSSVGYYSGLDGVEIKEMQLGDEFYVLCVSGAWYDNPKGRQAHRVKVEYTRTGKAFFRLFNQRIPLDECIRMGV